MIKLLLPFLLGCMVVTQPTLNRMLGEVKGYPVALLFNSSVLLVLAGSLFFFSWQYAGELPHFFSLKDGQDWRWWYFIPGALGFCIVFGTPISIQLNGALLTIALMFLGQILSSMLWDSLMQGQSISLSRVFGALLIGLGAYFAVKP